MSKVFISSDQLVKKLIDSGIIPDGCTMFRLTARVGEAVRLEYTTFADQGVFTIPWSQLDLNHEDVEQTT